MSYIYILDIENLSHNNKLYLTVSYLPIYSLSLLLSFYFLLLKAILTVNLVGNMKKDKI